MVVDLEVLGQGRPREVPEVILPFPHFQSLQVVGEVVVVDVTPPPPPPPVSAFHWVLVAAVVIPAAPADLEDHKETLVRREILQMEEEAVDPNSSPTRPTAVLVHMHPLFLLPYLQ